VAQRKTKPAAPAPLFFATPVQFRKWLEKNHPTATELWVGYYKKATGKPSITWPEAVDEALCFGWIDGIRKSIDDESYMNRFTPRRATSIWSRVNIGRVAALTAEGRMRPAGLAAFEKRKKTGVYSFEQAERPGLDAAAEKEFRKHRKAWSWFQQQAPWYQRTAGFYVMSAKKPETRARRLARLIADSDAGQRIGPMAASSKRVGG
jgi:uncharacterized protein YdeI (YjbR/CyaY-like superfamily)